MKPFIIGLYGPQGAGKSTVAKALEDEYGWKRLSFASAIRECVFSIWPKRPEEAHKNDHFIYDLTYRQVLQKFGAFARNEINKNIWVDACLNQAQQFPLVVIDDLRYNNEMEAIKNMDGEIVRIDCDDAPPQHANHESEKDWKEWIPDLHFNNSMRNSLAPVAIAESIDDILLNSQAN